MANAFRQLSSPVCRYEVATPVLMTFYQKEKILLPKTHFMFSMFP